ncbi:hypothetical protein C0993_010447 [Termitomyces sp. T159_Od127]|nr:hypothetical protein C0993_010447 [Termitomyces sp. T159_Od127]
MARVKQTRNANWKRQLVPFKEGDFAYMATKNMNFPKGTTLAECEPKHEGEWAADKIISHAKSGTDAIFEVLWLVGDKTWLPYDQVQDLNLLQPYLAAQEVNDITGLPLGAGNPPFHDPQTFLGALHFDIYKRSTPNNIHRQYQPSSQSINQENAREQLPTIYLHRYHLFEPRNATDTMTFCLDSHYECNPLLIERKDGMLQLSSVNPNLVVHPLQLLEYLEHDAAVRRRDPSADVTVPAGYAEFATAYNSVAGSNPCEFATRKPGSSTYNVDSIPLPASLLTYPFSDKRLSDLASFGLIQKDGSLNTKQWQMMKNALLRPHREAVRNQARSEARQAEKARKKRRLEEAREEAVYLARPRRDGPSQYSRRRPASPLLREPTPTSDRDADGVEDDEEMLEEPPLA